MVNIAFFYSDLGVLGICFLFQGIFFLFSNVVFALPLYFCCSSEVVFVLPEYFFALPGYSGGFLFFGSKHLCVSACKNICTCASRRGPGRLPGNLSERLFFGRASRDPKTAKHLFPGPLGTPGTAIFVGRPFFSLWATFFRFLFFAPPDVFFLLGFYPRRHCRCHRSCGCQCRWRDRYSPIVVVCLRPAQFGFGYPRGPWA